MHTVNRAVDAVVIGAGQAGLSTAYFLAKHGLERGSGFVVLDANASAGGAWQHRWSSLRVADVHGIYGLAGMKFDPGDPARPVSEVVPYYFAAYERRFDLPVLRPVRVTAVRHGPDGRLLVESDAGGWSARAVVNATGTWTRPFVPYYPGMQRFSGWQLHTAEFRHAEDFRDRRVVVVGGGLSAIGLLAAVSEFAAETTWVTRRPPKFTGNGFTIEDGRRVEAAVANRVRAGLPPASVVSATGLPETSAVRHARSRGLLDTRLPVFDRITEDGVAWDDGRFVAADTILWCTGFRHAIDHLAPLGLRTPGGGIRVDGTRAVDEPRLQLVGYGPSASTLGANRAGRVAARAVREQLSPARAA